MLYLFSFCKTSQLPAPPPDQRSGCLSSLSRRMSKLRRRCTQQPTRSLVIFRALSQWWAFFKRAKKARREAKFLRGKAWKQRLNPSGAHRNAHLLLDCPQPAHSLLRPLVPLHCSISEKAINEVLDFTTWLKNMLLGQWCSVRRLLAKNQLACCEGP